MQRNCNTCKTEKAVSDFYKCGKSNYQYKCIACCKEYSKSKARKLSLAKYSRSDKRKEASKRYKKSEKGIKQRKKDDRKRYWSDVEFYRLKNRSWHHKVQSSLIKDILNRDKTCQFCGSDKNLTIDHLHPVSLGGKSTKENLQVLCQGCNSFKNNRLFLPGGGFLVHG